MVADMEQRPGVFASRAPGMSRYQNSGSQSAARNRKVGTYIMSLLPLEP